MTGNESIWSEGWQERLLDRVRFLGHASVSDFVESHPGEPYGKLVTELGPGFAILQLQRLHMLEAIQGNRRREVAMDSLVRSIRQHLPSGWNVKKDSDRRRAFARAEWVVPVTGPEDFDDMNNTADEVWKQLNLLSPAKTWRPMSSADPLIIAAFNVGWPVAS